MLITGTAAAQLTITTPSALSDAVIGTPYSQQLQASGGTPGYTWSWVRFSSVPPFLTISSGGVISGTPGTLIPPGSTYTMNVQVTDAAGATATKTFSLTVQIVSPLAITSVSPLPNGTAGVRYYQTLTANGGAPPYTWSAGGLPLGLTLDTSSGTISGTPAAVGTFSVNVTVTDAQGQSANKTLRLSIGAAPLSITTGATLAEGAVATSYASTLQATGGTQPYSWSIIAGNLPAGLQFSANGSLSGTPTQAGTFNFTVQVMDANAATASKTFNLIIKPANLAITTTAPLPEGSMGTAYVHTMQATGGTQPYSWSIIAGNLPAGLQLSANGSLSGTPTQAGTVNFTVQVTDANGTTATKTFNLTIKPANLTITTASPLPDGVVSTPYLQTLATTGGTLPYGWALTGTNPLPPGLQLSPTGSISGTPTQTGTFTFTIQVTDANGSKDTKAFTLRITGGGPLIITTPAALPDGMKGAPYQQPLAATGGTQPYAWALTGTNPLPPGLQLGPTGSISGTPTQTGTFTFTIQVTDAAGSRDVRTFTLKIAGAGPLTITTASPLPNATVGVPYQQTISAIGGAPPYRWRFPLGDMHGFLSAIDPATGILTGTPQPSEAGQTITFRIQVTDSAEQVAIKEFTLLVVGANTGALRITTASPLPDGSLGLPYAQTISATGGSLPYRWSWSGNVPPGLSLDAASGAISGTPSATGTFTFTVKVTDSQGATDQKQFTLTIGVDPNVIPAGPRPAVSPMAVAVDTARHVVYVVNRKSYKQNGIDLTYDNIIPTNIVTVMEEASGKVVASYKVGKADLADSLGIAVDSRRNRVYVTNSDDNTLSVIDPAGSTVTTIRTGSKPRGVAVDPTSGIVYVANSGDNTVTVLDPGGATLGAVAVGGSPAGVAFDPVSRQAYVALDKPARLAVLRGPTSLTEVPIDNLVLATVSSIAVDPGQRAYVNCGHGIVSIFDISGAAPRLTGNFEAMKGDDAEGLAVDPVTHLLYITIPFSDEVRVFTSGGTRVNIIGGGRTPTGIAIDEIARLGFVANTYANSVTTIDLQTQSVIGRNIATVAATGLAFDAASRRLFVGNAAGDSLAVLDVDAKTVLANWPTGGRRPWAVALDPALQQAYVVNFGGGGTLSVMSMIDGTVKALIDISPARAGQVAVSPSTHKAYVTSGDPGSDTVLVYDGNTNQVITKIRVGGSAVGVAVDDFLGVVYVASKGTGLITVIDIASDQVLVQWQPNAESIWDLALDPYRGLLYVLMPRASPAAYAGILALDQYTGEEIWRIATRAYPALEVVNPVTGNVFFSAADTFFFSDNSTGSVTSVDPDSGHALKTLRVGRQPVFLTVDPDTGTVYVSNLADGTIGVIPDR